MPARCLVCGLALGALGCSNSGTPESAERTVAGVAGTSDGQGLFSGIVGIVTRQGDFVSRCTGTLVAPKLLLTARHCVSFDDGNLVECGQAPLGAAVAPVDVLVTAFAAQSDDPADYVAATEIIFAPGGDDTCGFDFAAVVLTDMPRGATATYAPRLDSDVVPGESFTAVGYGTDGNAGLGTRRYLEGALVACSGSGSSACPLPEVQSNEWLAEDDAFCRADSGAAALDSEGRLLGTVSRGQGACETPILAAMPPWKDWLLEVARQSAVGDTPDWAMAPAEPPDGPLPAEPSDAEAPKLASTCAFSLPCPPGSGPWLGATACLVTLLARRRRG
jgi:hypothetical protein